MQNLISYIFEIFTHFYSNLSLNVRGPAANAASLFFWAHVFKQALLHLLAFSLSRFLRRLICKSCSFNSAHGGYSCCCCGAR